jgi:sortase A
LKDKKKFLKKIIKPAIIILLIGLLLIISLKLHKTVETNHITQTSESQMTQEVEPQKQKMADQKLIGRITIPSIHLQNAPIKQGIELDLLKRYVGHFPQTPSFNGNVALASHNGGGRGEYFKNLHKVKLNDVIYYNSLLGNRKYQVTAITKIQETDMSCLESSDENRLTLITCVRNQSELRLCVVANEIIN